MTSASFVLLNERLSLPSRDIARKAFRLNAAQQAYVDKLASQRPGTSLSHRKDDGKGELVLQSISQAASKACKLTESRCVRHESIFVQ